MGGRLDGGSDGIDGWMRQRHGLQSSVTRDGDGDARDVRRGVLGDATAWVKPKVKPWAGLAKPEAS